MYEDNEKKINWLSIAKKAGIVLIIILVILGIVALVNSCTKKKNNKPNNTEYSLESQLDQMEEATIKYLTKDNLPTEINSSKTIRLKILISKNLTENIVDQEKTTCDPNESYSEVTKLDNNYAVKISLSCGKNKANRVIYVGCFEKCNGGICKGSESDTDGICGETTKPTEEENKDNTTEEKPSTNPPVNTNKPTTPTTKPSNPSTPSKPTTPTTPNTPDNNNKPATKVTEYEYQKCEKVKVCTKGTMNANGECVVYGTETLYDTVVKVPGKTYTAYKKVPAQTKTETTTVYFKKSTDAKNTATVTYKFVKILSDGRIQYQKTEKKTYCSNSNVTPVNGFCNVPYTAKSADTYTCKNAHLGYKYSNGVCSKQESKIIEITQPVYKNSMCNTKWSSQTSLAGWTRTGRTRTR